MTFTKRSEVSNYYNENWCIEYTSDEDLNTRIVNMAKAGGYKLCVNVNSTEAYDALWAKLTEAGYGVENYNGYHGMLMIDFG
jgi:hypothetical protein